MVELLMAVQAAAEQVAQTVQAPAVHSYGQYGPVVTLLLAMGGWKGLAQGILWLQSRKVNGNGNGNGSRKHVVYSDTCSATHKGIDQRMADFHEDMNRGFDRLERKIDGHSK